MDQGMFRAWLAEIDGLTAKQRQELEAVLAGRQPRAAVAAAIEERLGEARRCPHCGGASVGGGRPTACAVSAARIAAELQCADRIAAGPIAKRTLAFLVRR